MNKKLISREGEKVFVIPAEAGIQAHNRHLSNRLLDSLTGSIRHLCHSPWRKRGNARSSADICTTSSRKGNWRQRQLLRNLYRFKLESICDIGRGSNCASALQYVPELTWILFLRIFNAQEAKGRDQAEAVKALARLTPRRLSFICSR